MSTCMQMMSAKHYGLRYML